MHALQLFKVLVVDMILSLLSAGLCEYSLSSSEFSAGFVLC